MRGLSPMAARMARVQAGFGRPEAARGLQLELFGRPAPATPPRALAPSPGAQVRRHPSDPARVRVFGNFAQVCAALEILCAGAPGPVPSP